MTITSDKYKFVFIHIPKTAGTSISDILRQLDGPMGYYTHINISEIWKSEYEDYFKFTFVRNPWDRMVSSYHYYSRRNKSKQWFNKLFNNCKDFLENSNKCPNEYNFIRTQSSWITDKKGNLNVDYVGKFENLIDDFNYVCYKLNIPHKILPYSKKTKHKHYSYYYSNKAIDKIANIYKKDIELGDYKFEVEE